MTRRTPLLVLLGLALAFALPTTPAQAMHAADAPAVGCFDPPDVGASARGDHVRGADHRDVSIREHRAIERRTQQILDRRGISAKKAAARDISVPTYVHVMAGSDGSGNVPNRQIARQMAVLNKTFGGGESNEAADTAFTFTLEGIDRFFNDTWHTDHQSNFYRTQTRQGGADALNIWLVDFKYLGIAVFPWDYEQHGGIDGIRVHFDSLPGGSIANFNLGETATHEVGHWLGLYHTFEGGCKEPNDEVTDTPAQSSPTSGCPVGRDSCVLPGLDPIHNYMDYSFDSCYTEFTSGQSSRMSSMFAAYRAG